MAWPDWTDEIWTPVPTPSESEYERFCRWLRLCVRKAPVQTYAGTMETYQSPRGVIFHTFLPLSIYSPGTSPAEKQWEKEKNGFV